MATLTIPNVPPSVLAFLQDRAAKSNRTVEEEALRLIEAHVLERPGDAEPGSLDFPRPLQGPRVAVRIGGERLPAPLAVEDTLPE